MKKTRKNKRRLGGRVTFNNTPKIIGALTEDEIQMRRTQQLREAELARQREAELARQREAELARQREANQPSMLDLLNSYAPRGGRRTTNRSTKKHRRKYKK